MSQNTNKIERILDNGDILKTYRVNEFGYEISVAGKKYYFFVGHRNSANPSFMFCELLTVEDDQSIEEFPFIDDLRKDDFSHEGKGKTNDFIYRKIKPYNEAEAKALLEKYLKIFKVK